LWFRDSNSDEFGAEKSEILTPQNSKKDTSPFTAGPSRTTKNCLRIIAGEGVRGEKKKQTPAALPCHGDINVVRISEIKPGMMAKFLAAVAAQQAWYKQAGTTDRIEVMRIMDRGPNTKAYSLSETQAITTHSISTSAKNPAHDAGYDAFVAMFGESSTIKTTYMTCMAK
jgi:hypothetical protein